MRANWLAQAGGVTQVNVEAFAANAALGGNAFLAQGVQLAGTVPGGTDTDSTLDTYPGFTRCFTGLNAGGLRVLDSTGASEAGVISITFTTPVRAVGLLITQDPEGGDTRSMRIFDSGNTLIGVSSALEDDNDNTTSAFHGWVGAAGELAKTVVISDLDPSGAATADAFCISAIEFTAPAPAVSVPVPATGTPWAILATLALLLIAAATTRRARR